MTKRAELQTTPDYLNTLDVLSQGVEWLAPEQWSSERGKFLAYAKAHLGASHEEADDLVQEAFIRLFRLEDKPDFSGGIYCFRAWFRVTIQRLWVDSKRAQQVRYKHALGVTSSLEIGFQAKQPKPDENLFMDKFHLLARSRMTVHEWTVFRAVVLNDTPLQEFLLEQRASRTPPLTWRDALRKARRIAILCYAEVAGKEAEPYLNKLEQFDPQPETGLSEDLSDLLAGLGADF
jgi:hypothetical protein